MDREAICSWLPHLPNVVGLGRWLKDWALGKLSHFPDAPARMVEPPTRFLPPLSDLEDGEPSARANYWLSALILFVPSTIVTCELIQRCAIGAKHLMRQGHTRWNSSIQMRRTRRAESESQQGLQFEESEMSPEPEGSDDSETSEEDVHEFGRDTLFLLFVFLYNVCCMLIVGMAFTHDWLSPTTGLAWELWFLWEAMIMTSHMVQTVVRCCWAWSVASLAKPIATSVIPMMSEPMDTFKDWIISALFLITFPFTVVGGVVLSFFVILMDVSFGRLMFAGFQIPMSAVCSLFAIHACALAPVIWLVSYCLGPDVLLNVLLYVAGVFGDGCFCAVMSVYTIFASVFAVHINLGSTSVVRKSYLSILELPYKPALVDHLTCMGRVGRVYTDILTDLTSSARLLISWHEDLPQGVLGLRLVFGSDGSIGFAAFSVIASFLKGVLIPAGRQIVFSWKLFLFKEERRRFEQGLATEWSGQIKEAGAAAVLRPIPDKTLKSALAWYLDRQHEVFKRIWTEAEQATSANVAGKAAKLILEELHEGFQKRAIELEEDSGAQAADARLDLESAFKSTCDIYIHALNGVFGTWGKCVRVRFTYADERPPSITSRTINVDVIRELRPSRARSADWWEFFF